ncbi:DUF1460 domain-containing protein [Mycobacterium sp. TJFP1]
MPRYHHMLAFVAVLLAAVAGLSTGSAHAAPPVEISEQSEQILQSMLAADGGSPDAELISRQFLGTPYGANTLVGSATVPEQLVVDLKQVDCFTYADYVEALKRADSRDEFIRSLVDVRYRNGDVTFENRKHFFTDWAASAPAVATNITATVSENALQSMKNLNAKDSGGVYLPGLPVVPRSVAYIPSAAVDAAVVGRLRTGDYLGAYAEDGGLDVTHVGIFVDTPDGPVFRNASSSSADGKVVDSALDDYLQTVPGIVVLRPVV